MYIMGAYDEALRFILKYGSRRKNRTGIDTLSVFSMRSVYPIDRFFPLVTKRKLYPRAVFAELLWMLSGSTNNDDLVRLGANFWTPWVDLKHPDNQAFYEQTKIPHGYLGPVYGWQLRRFGANYMSWLAVKDDRRWTNQQEMDRYLGGFDQISWLIDEIRKNPQSRRLVVSMWNPKDMHLMRLPPCHYSFHVDIDEERRMTLLLNQRSCDFPVGVPANIQFYSALCYMLAQQTDCRPHLFIHNTEDSHIYVNQTDQVEEYLSRPDGDSPTLTLHPADDIFSYSVDNFEISGYNPGSVIKMPVAV